jgi:ELWxxDGT repeat protein
VTDGTAAGTFVLQTFSDTSGATTPYGFSAIGNGQAVFQANDGVHGMELWITDGTVAGTTLLKDTNPGSANGNAQHFVTISVTVPNPPVADPLFDTAYYLAHNPDVATSGVDPYVQYMTVGWQQNRNPNAWFDSRFYLTQNPDVAAAGVNPLTHFENSGWKEGRQPSLLFSDSAYLTANPDVAAAGLDPLEHYIRFGQFEGRAAGLTGFDGNLGAVDPLVNAATFDAQLGASLIPTGIAGQAQAAEIYSATGWKQGLNPNAWFDTNYYLAQNPDVAAAGINPLLHFEQFGWREGRDPSLVFSDSKYLAQNPDVAAAGLDPLAHYIQFGQNEGRMSFLSGGTLPADPLVNAAFYDRQLGASIVPTGPAAAQQAAWSYDQTGWQKGLNPDAFFDTNYYLSHNPDVAAAHIDPLLHYENNGWLEGRDPSAQFSTAKYLAAYSDVKAAGMDPLLHYVQFGQAEGRSAFAV